jgi:phenylacetate-CoA ligase
MRIAPTWLNLLWRRRYLRHNAIESSELDQRQKRDLVAARLLDQIRYFGSREDALPEWKDAARITDPGELWRVWSSLPVVTKSMLRERFPAREIGKRFGIAGQLNSTGGSTGEPTEFFHDDAMIRSNNALSDWTARRMGWRPGMATVIVWGSERDIGRDVPFKTRLHYALARQVLLDGYHLTADTARRAADAVRAHGPVAFYGFTSMLAEVARLVIANRLEIPPGGVRTAWNGGEILLDSQSEIFARAFGVPILNRYGSREMGYIACQYEPAGLIRISRPWYHAEIVDEAGRPAESGRLLVTSTVCRGTPFLRYQIEDMATVDSEGADEAGIAGLRRIDGRLAGLLDLPNGKRINNIFWNHLFKEFAEVEQFQVTLRTDDTILLRLRGPGLSPDREAALRRGLEPLLTSVRYDLVWVDRIPLTSRGKLLQVINEKAALR